VKSSREREPTRNVLPALAGRSSLFHPARIDRRAAGNGQPSTGRRKAKEPVGCGLRIAGGGEDRTRITLEDQPFLLWGQWQNSNEIPFGRKTPLSRGWCERDLRLVSIVPLRTVRSEVTSDSEFGNIAETVDERHFYMISSSILAGCDQKIIIPWRVIDGPESADAVANEIMKTASSPSRHFIAGLSAAAY
jgi:hypothetical protein